MYFVCISVIRIVFVYIPHYILNTRIGSARHVQSNMRRHVLKEVKVKTILNSSSFIVIIKIVNRIAFSKSRRFDYVLTVRKSRSKLSRFIPKIIRRLHMSIIMLIKTTIMKRVIVLRYSRSTT